MYSHETDLFKIVLKLPLTLKSKWNTEVKEHHGIFRKIGISFSTPTFLKNQEAFRGNLPKASTLSFRIRALILI